MQDNFANGFRIRTELCKISEGIAICISTSNIYSFQMFLHGSYSKNRSFLAATERKGLSKETIRNITALTVLSVCTGYFLINGVIKKSNKFIYNGSTFTSWAFKPFGSKSPKDSRRPTYLSSQTIYALSYQQQVSSGSI